MAKRKKKGKKWKARSTPTSWPYGAAGQGETAPLYQKVFRESDMLRLVDEYKLDVSVEHACDVFKPETFQELKKRNIPVIFGPVDAFAYKVELKHENWRNIKHLVESKVEFGLMTDHPVTPSSMLFTQTRWFSRFGFSKQKMVELVSRKNAELLGIDNVLGSLVRGKWASFICFSGDPFVMTSYPLAVYGEGRLLHEE